MKKFDRLPQEQRKQEICTAALALFLEKGFAATTMENIVKNVTLSKGGVYRIYPSTTAILRDLILQGMHLRNAFYEQRVQEEIRQGRALSLPFLVDMIGDSLTLYPEYSGVYVEFLWEKQRNPELQQLYSDITEQTVRETLALMEQYGAEKLLPDPDTLRQISELMNGAILSISVLGLREDFEKRKKQLAAAVIALLQA